MWTFRWTAAGPPSEADPVGKTVGKSANPIPGNVPFAVGDDPRRGAGPLPGAPNAGRPPSAVREAMRLSAASRVSVLEEIADNPTVAPGDRRCPRPLETVMVGCGR